MNGGPFDDLDMGFLRALTQAYQAIAMGEPADTVSALVTNALRSSFPAVEFAIIKRAMLRDDAAWFPIGSGDGMFYLWVSEPPSRTTFGPLSNAIGRAIDVLELAARRAAERAALETAARTDPLTGTANRRAFDSDLSQLSKSPRTMWAVLYIDLDGFKAVNDCHGHLVGDAVLVEVAQRIERAVRSDDTVARLGGDEFGVICGELHDAQVAIDIAERILASLSQPFKHVHPLMAASIGIAVTARSEHLSRLVDIADQALLAAKSAGKGCYRLINLDKPRSPFAPPSPDDLRYAG